MTTALYRRYRPDTFQDVIGQEHVTAPLMAALRADRVTHAYLFSGPRGCGKTTSARILARCLNCAQAPTDTPCGTCPSCLDLATGGPGSLDVVEIDAASHNGVDDARDLRERAAFAPARDRYKIFILDEAHMVTAQGFNALLKLVEEPPAHVKFIFATTEPEKVIGTIRSRTHHYPFRLVPPDTLEAYLAQLCQAEGVEAGPGVFPLVVRAGGGSVRDTLSVMDQLIGGARDGAVDYQRAVALLGYTDITMLDQCVDAIAAADGAGVFRVVDRVVTSGHDPRRFVEDLLQRLRDLLVIALAGDQAGPALGSLPVDELSRMDVQARTMGAAALSRAADMTAQALTAMVGATSPRLQLELLVARLIVPAGAQGVGPAAAAVTAGPAAQAGATGGPGAPSRSGAAPGSGREPAAQAARQASRGSATDSPPTAGAEGAPGAGAPSPRAGAAAGGLLQPGATRAAGGDAPRGPGAAPGSAPPSAIAPSGEPQGAREPQGPGAAEGEMLRTRWEEVLEAAKRSRRATWALVGPNSRPGTLANGVLTLLFNAPGLVGAFENGGHGPVLAAAIHQALGLQVEVRAMLAGDDAPGDSGGPGGSGGGRGGGPGAGPKGGAGSPGGPGGGAGARGQRGHEGPGGPGGASGSGGWEGSAGVIDSAGLLGGGEGEPAPEGWEAVPPAGAAGHESSDAATPMDRGGAASQWSGARPLDGGRAAQSGAAPPGVPADPGRVGPEHVDPERVAGPDSPGSPALAVTGPSAISPGPPPERDEHHQGMGASPDDESPSAPGPAPGTAARAESHGSPSAATGAPPSDDGWGPVAIPGGGASQSLEGQGATGPGPEPGPGTVPEAGPAESPARGPVAQPGPGPRGASAPTVGAGRGAEDDGWGPVATPGSATLGQGQVRSQAGPLHSEAQGSQGDGEPEEGRPHLATVHRLRALSPTPAGPTPSGTPASPGPAVTTSSAPGTARTAGPAGAVDPDSPLGALGSASWEEPATFSDGIPLPEEPGDPDGPAPQDSRTWAPSGMAGSRLAAAMAAARAAAQSEDASLTDDTPSEDDEDAEDAGVVGLEVVKRILGATVIEEITVTQEGH